MNTYIGVDLGTSAVKLLLADENGKVLSSASESYPVFTRTQVGASRTRTTGWPQWSAQCRGFCTGLTVRA